MKECESGSKEKKNCDTRRKLTLGRRRRYHRLSSRPQNTGSNLETDANLECNSQTNSIKKPAESESRPKTQGKPNLFQVKSSRDFPSEINLPALDERALFKTSNRKISGIYASKVAEAFCRKKPSLGQKSELLQLSHLLKPSSPNSAANRVDAKPSSVKILSASNSIARTSARETASLAFEESLGDRKLHEDRNRSETFKKMRSNRQQPDYLRAAFGNKQMRRPSAKRSAASLLRCND